MRQVKPEDFKIRCSAIGQICTGTIGLTDAQEAEYESLATKKTALTVKQAIKINQLANKKYNPELPQTAKSYCEKWLKEHLYKRRKQINTKEMEKGILCEDQSIELIAEALSLGMVFKNETRLDNDFMTGEADLVLSDIVIDIKNSFDCFTFPLFESDIDKGYELQLQGYMYLYKKQKAKLVYTLMSLPEDLMLSEIFYGQKYDIDEDEVRAYHTYDGVDLSLRIKSYDFDFDPSVIEMIKERVRLCRLYIAELLSELS